ncbi:MAG: hypothetical protein ACREIW_03645 [Chthoniobacterales bacterium]
MTKQDVSWSGQQDSNLHQPLDIATCDSDKPARNRGESRVKPGFDSDIVRPPQRRFCFELSERDAAKLDGYAYYHGIKSVSHAARRLVEMAIRADTHKRYAAPYPISGWPVHELTVDGRRLIGIYFLVALNKVVYVGQSTNVLARVHAHSANIEFDRAFYLPCAADELDTLEVGLIARLKPRYNKHAGNVCRSVDAKTAVRLIPFRSRVR